MKAFSAPLLLVSALAACSSAPSRPPWGSSLKAPQLQVVRLARVSGVQRLGGGDLWITGNGYARIRGGSAFYMWNSSTPPLLEISVRKAGLAAVPACEALAKQPKPPGTLLALEGDGFFDGDAELGKFQFESLAKCELVPGP